MLRSLPHTILAFAFFLIQATTLQAEGQVDLGSWNLAPMTLDGSWFVEPGLVAPSEIPQRAATVPPATAPITTPFTGIDGLPRKIKATDSVTFSLKLTSLREGDYGFRMRADTSAAAYLIAADGDAKSVQTIMMLGNPGDKTTTVPEIANKLGQFKVLKSGDYWIVLHVANYHYREGQVWMAPVIGPAPLMHEKWIGELLAETFTLGIVFILAVYNLSLFFNRREDLANLWLAGYCLFSLFRFVGMSGFFIPSLFPESTLALHHGLRVLEIGFAPLASSCLLHFGIENFGNKKYWRGKARLHLTACVI